MLNDEKFEFSDNDISGEDVRGVDAESDMSENGMPESDTAETEMTPEERERYEQELIRQNVMNNERAAKEAEAAHEAEETEPEVLPEEPEKNKKTKKAKKEVPKKRRGCCFHTCMVFLVFNFICMVAIIGVGWFFGDQYSRQYLDMSLTDTFGVVTGITASSGKIVDNKFDQETDEAGFYDALGGAIMLKEGAIDGDELKETVVNGLKGGSEYNEEEDLGASLGNYAVELLTAENLDNEKIEAIGTPDQNTDLVVSDKQLGAFLNGIISSAVDGFLADELKKAGAEQYGIDVDKLSLESYVNLEQLKLYVENRKVNDADTDVNMARVTVSINFKKALKEIKKTIDVDALVNNNFPSAQSYTSLIRFGAKSAINLVKAILPSKLYLTVDMGLSHNVEPVLYINKMGLNNNKMENLYKLLKAVDFDLKAKLNEVFVEEGGAVKNALDQVNQTVDLKSVLTDGGINCDVYQLVIDIAKLNYTTNEEGEKVLKPSEEQITSDDVLGTMKLVLADNTQYLEDLKDDKINYKNVKFRLDENGELDLSSGLPVIEDFGKQYYVTSGEELDRLVDNYGTVIIDKFTQAYGLKEGYELDEIIENFSGDSQSPLDMFDAQKLKAIIEGEAEGVEFDDRMLGALFMNMLPDMLEETEFTSDDLGIEYIYLEKREAFGEDHCLMHIGLNLDISSITGKLEVNETIKKVINNLLADRRFIVETAIDITLNSQSYLETEIEMNGNSTEALNKLLTSLGAFGRDEDGYAVGFGGYIEGLMSPLHEVIDRMGEMLPGLTLGESLLKLPDIYAAIAGVINNEKQTEIDAESVEDALKLIIAADPLSDPDGEYAFFNDRVKVEEYYKACEDELVNLLDLKYALKNSVVDDATGKRYKLTLADLLYVLKVNEKPSSDEAEEILSDVKMADLLEPEILETNALGDNSSKWQERLAVSVTNNRDYQTGGHGDMFTALIREAVFDGNHQFGKLQGHLTKDDFLYATLVEENGKNYVEITVRLVLKDVVSETDNESQKFIKDLLPDAPSVVKMRIDISDGDVHDDCVVVLNDSEESSEKLFDMLDALDFDFDFDEAGNSIRNAIQDLNKSFEGIEFGDRVMVLPNVFKVIDQIMLDGSYGDTKVKLAFAGIYQTSETKTSNDKTRLEEFEDKLGGTKPAADSSVFINEIKDKYFIKDEKIGEAKTFEDLSKVIDVSSFDANSIIMTEEKTTAGEKTDRKGLAYTNRTDLTPHIALPELGAMIVEKLPEKVKLYDLTINEDKNIVFDLSVDINKVFEDTSKKLDEMIGVKTIFVTMTVYINEASLPTGNNERYYRSDIRINKMDSDVNDTFIGMAGKFSGSNAVGELDKLEIDVGKAMYNAFNKLETMYGKGGYTVTENGVELSDVFAFLGKNIIKNENEKVSGESVRSAIQGMYARNDENNDRNYKKDDIVLNTIDKGNFDFDSKDTTEIAGKIIEAHGMLDREMGSYVSEKTKNGEKDKDVEILQLNILAASPTADSDNKKDREYLNARLHKESALSDSEVYMALTVSAPTSKFGDNMGTNSQAVMPEKMVVTFILKLQHETKDDKAKDQFVYHDFIMNAMNADARDTLIKLTGMEVNKVTENVKSISKDPIDKLNELFNAFTQNGYNITCSFKEADKTEAEAEKSTARGKYDIAYDGNAQDHLKKDN